MKLATLLLTLTSIVAACAPSQPTDPLAPSPVVLPLATAPGAGPDGITACAGVGLSTVLTGDPGDPRIAWLEPFDGGAEPALGVLWPPGYAAQFAPNLEVLDEHGRVVMHAGDFVDGGCVVGRDRFIALVPPFVSLRLVCGPMDPFECPSLIYRAAQAAGWPERDIAEIRFVAPDGRFSVTYEDGTVGTGKAEPGL